jgi:hypothetical protein
MLAGDSRRAESQVLPITRDHGGHPITRFFGVFYLGTPLFSPIAGRSEAAYNPGTLVILQAYSGWLSKGVWPSVIGDRLAKDGI